MNFLNSFHRIILYSNGICRSLHSHLILYSTNLFPYTPICHQTFQFIPLHSHLSLYTPICYHTLPFVPLHSHLSLYTPIHSSTLPFVSFVSSHSHLFLHCVCLHCYTYSNQHLIMCNIIIQNRYIVIEAYITLCYGLAYIVTILVPIQAFLVQEYAVLCSMCVYGEPCTYSSGATLTPDCFPLSQKSARRDRLLS